MTKEQLKVASMTGETRGLGLETARGLWKMGITVILASRCLAKGERAVKELLADGVVGAGAIKLEERHPMITAGQPNISKRNSVNESYQQRRRDA